MSRIILIETSTSLCSAAVVIDGKIAASRECSTPRAHAAMTTPIIKEVLDECGMLTSDCYAVCVSAGPGSYTGLRVGVSTAKGLCFATGIPLLSVNTLEVLAWQAIESRLIPEGCNTIIPMVDARRMEVYTAVYDLNVTQKSEIEAKVIDGSSFADLLENGPVLFIGDGAAKCSSVINSPNAHFIQTPPHATAMLKPALREFETWNFRDMAYFEPFYLKQFVATTSKKNVLGIDR